MLDFTLQLSGDEDSEEFRAKVEEIRNFVVNALGESDFATLEIRSVVGVGFRSPYSFPGIRYATPMRHIAPTGPSSKVSSFLDGYVVSSRNEAEAVLEQMQNIIEKYEVCTVGDLKEMLGLNVTAGDSNLGWTQARQDSTIHQVREGWRISLPEPSIIP